MHVFVAGTFLSLAASVLLHETGGALGWQMLVNIGGVAALLAFAHVLEARRAPQKTKRSLPTRLEASGLSAS